mgnify:CR=1 FL=1
MVKIQDLDVGDLVTFCGYNYTPDFIIYDPTRDGTMGIVIERLPTVNSSTRSASLFRAYRVYWFKSRDITIEIRDHLSLQTFGEEE